MSYFKFKSGRQGTGYDTMTLVFAKLPLWLSKLTGVVGYDAYIIRYNDGSHIPPHIDGVSEGLEHHRLNTVLKSPKSGGEFICSGAYRLFNRLFYFRPDIMMHEVTVCQGVRLIFSIGFTKTISHAINKKIQATRT